ncbi:MAG: butyrate kinase [Treponema sp.]|nr:MAG: butyrate kinase [Treponema sp.]
MKTKYLIMNPGSTSTKLALFEDETQVHEHTIRHDESEIAQFKTIPEQKDFRKKLILDFLSENNIELESIDCFVGRGGLLHPLVGGTYNVNEKMLADLASEEFGSHASNLGASLADELAKINGKKAFIVDPVCVDELEDIARISGLKEIDRVSIFHALNQKAIAYRHSEIVGKPYDKLKLIVAHLGGGISVGYHRNGRVVDVNNALNGEGPFSPERSGSLPVASLVEMCFSGEYTKKEILKKITGLGGLMSYLNTSSGIKIMEQINAGDAKTKAYYDAMIYQIIKEIGSLYFAAKGEIDGVLITGGLSYGEYLVNEIKSYIQKIVPVYVYPGEDEMTALMQGAKRVIEGKEEAKTYT